MTYYSKPVMTSSILLRFWIEFVTYLHTTKFVSIDLQAIEVRRGLGRGGIHSLYLANFSDPIPFGVKQSYTPKKLGNFYYVIEENGLRAFFGPPTWLPQYKCMEIFQTLESRNPSIYWYIDLKIAETFQNRVIHIV